MQGEHVEQHQAATTARLKKPPNAYILFQNAVGDRVRRELGLRKAQWKKIVGERWTELTEQEQAPFREEAARLRELHKARRTDVKDKRTNKKNKEPVSNTSGSLNAPNASSGEGYEVQFQGRARLQGVEERGSQDVAEARTSAYREIKWEPVQLGHLHGTATRLPEAPQSVPPQMCSVFESSATQVPTEPLTSTQVQASPGMPIQAIPRGTSSDESCPLVTDLIAPSPSPASFSERSLSGWSTPSSTSFPTPASVVFEAPLPQAQLSWPMEGTNRPLPRSELDIYWDFTNEELITNNSDIFQSSPGGPLNSDLHPTMIDLSPTYPPTFAPSWTGQCPSSSEAGQSSLPLVDRSREETSLVSYSDTQFAIQPRINAEEHQTDRSSAGYASSAGLQGFGYEFGGMLEELVNPLFSW